MSGRPQQAWQVIELTTEQTYPMRRSVLRDGTPSDEVRFAEDDLAGVRHLGVLDDGSLVGISTWVPRSFAAEPDARAVQMRGMATVQSHRSKGIGAALVDAGCERAMADGVELLWANARDAALAFYIGQGFEVVGDGFIDATTGLPHHVVIRRLT
jgi:GNAT superfamily N-acetyltransferase